MTGMGQETLPPESTTRHLLTIPRIWCRCWLQARLWWSRRVWGLGKACWRINLVNTFGIIASRYAEHLLSRAGQRKSRHLQLLETQAQKKNDTHGHTDKDDNTSSVPSFDVESEDPLFGFGMIPMLAAGLSHDTPSSTADRAPNSENAEAGRPGGPSLDTINRDILSRLGMSANAQPAFPPELPFSSEHLSMPEIPPPSRLRLPWPFPLAAWSESKLIHVFSLPVEMRPKIAPDPMV